MFFACASGLLAGCQNGNPFLQGRSLTNGPPPSSFGAAGAPGPTNPLAGTLPNGAAANGTPGNPLNPLLTTAAKESQYFAGQLQEAQKRLAQLDAGNRELTSQIAQAQQVLQSEREQKKLIQQQLADAASKLRETVNAKDDIERRASAVFASQRQQGGASITANNSIRTSLRTAEMAGLEVRQEGTTIRCEIPTDRLFAPGTFQLQQNAGPLLDELAASIRKNYPRQLIVVEGHTDGAPAYAASPALSHQTSAGQAHAVLDYLLTRGQLPPAQLSSMAFGSHRPRVSNATPQGLAKNRRVELVIYPDTIDGRP